MKWWDPISWSLFFECWILIQLFHSPLSLSSRDPLLPLLFLPWVVVICVSEVIITHSVFLVYFSTQQALCAFCMPCGILICGYRHKPDPVPVLTDTTFQRKTDSMHDRCVFSGDAQEERRVKEWGMLLQRSGKTCLWKSVNWDLNARRDGVMQRWWCLFQAEEQIKIKVRGQSMQRVCHQVGDVAGSAVTKGRVRGGEVREDNSG